MSDTVDVLAFGAHPDDVEMAVGGTLLALATKAYRFAIVDMTRGEMGTRGTPQIRASEATAAAEILGATTRRNLGLRDGHVTRDEDSLRRVIEVVREFRPRLVLAPVEEDLHPDHLWTGRVVREACYLSGLKRWDASGVPHRPRGYLGYASHTVFEPSLVVDITAHFARKKEACLAYHSQFHDPDSTEDATYISSPAFWDWWEARARHFGHRIGATFGEPLLHHGALPVDDPVALFDTYGYYPPATPGS